MPSASSAGVIAGSLASKRMLDGRKHSGESLQTTSSGKARDKQSSTHRRSSWLSFQGRLNSFKGRAGDTTRGYQGDKGSVTVAGSHQESGNLAHLAWLGSGRGERSKSVPTTSIIPNNGTSGEPLWVWNPLRQPEVQRSPDELMPSSTSSPAYLNPRISDASPHRLQVQTERQPSASQLSLLKSLSSDTVRKRQLGHAEAAVNLRTFSDGGSPMSEHGPPSGHVSLESEERVDRNEEVSRDLFEGDPTDGIMDIVQDVPDVKGAQPLTKDLGRLPTLGATAAEPEADELSKSLGRNSLDSFRTALTARLPGSTSNSGLAAIADGSGEVADHNMEDSIEEGLKRGGDCDDNVTAGTGQYPLQAGPSAASPPQINQQNERGKGSWTYRLYTSIPYLSGGGSSELQEGLKDQPASAADVVAPASMDSDGDIAMQSPQPLESALDASQAASSPPTDVLVSDQKHTVTSATNDAVPIAAEEPLSSGWWGFVPTWRRQTDTKPETTDSKPAGGSMTGSVTALPLASLQEPVNSLTSEETVNTISSTAPVVSMETKEDLASVAAASAPNSNIMTSVNGVSTRTAWGPYLKSWVVKDRSGIDPAPETMVQVADHLETDAEADHPKKDDSQNRQLESGPNFGLAKTSPSKSLDHQGSAHLDIRPDLASSLEPPPNNGRWWFSRNVSEGADARSRVGSVSSNASEGITPVPTVSHIDGSKPARGAEASIKSGIIRPGSTLGVKPKKSRVLPRWTATDETNQAGIQTTVDISPSLTARPREHSPSDGNMTPAEPLGIASEEVPKHEDPDKLGIRKEAWKGINRVVVIGVHGFIPHSHIQKYGFSQLLLLCQVLTYLFSLQSHWESKKLGLFLQHAGSIDSDSFRRVAWHRRRTARKVDLYSSGRCRHCGRKS